jgi:hypothetical protein
VFEVVSFIVDKLTKAVRKKVLKNIFNF